MTGLEGPPARSAARPGVVEALRAGHAVRERLPALPAAGLILVVAGAAVVWDPQAFYGFVAVKAATAGTGTALLVLWLARRSALVLPVGRWPVAAMALGGVMVAATLASDSILRSLLGAPLRHEGLIAWIGFAVASAAGLSLRRANRDAAAASLVDAAVVAVAAVGAAGTLELLGVELDADLSQFEGRVRSTLGNPAAVSGFLVLVGPVAALAAARRGLWRWAGAAAVALAATSLVAAQTRSAWAAAVSVYVAASLLAARGRIRLLIGASALAAAAAASFSGRWQQFGHDLRERAALWEVAASSVADRPLLGRGPEMFIASYGEQVSDETVRRLGDTTIDRAHSGLLDFAASFGAVAGGLYLAVLLGVAVLAYRAVRSGDGFRAAVGIGVTSYTLAQQAFFVHASTDMVWWLMVGFLVADSGLATRPLPRVGAALMLSAVSILAVNALSSARNDRIYERSTESTTAAEAYELLDQAASHRPFDDLSYILMGDLLSRTSDPRIVADGIERIRRGAEHNDAHALVAVALIDAQMQAHRVTADTRHATDARQAAGELIAAQPANGVAHLKRGLAAWYLDDFAAARADWERAAYLLPDRPEPRQNLAVLDAGTHDTADRADPRRPRSPDAEPLRRRAVPEDS